MNHDLRVLRIRVQRDIESYVYAVPSGTLGNPIPTDRVQAFLGELQNSLVEPYMATVTLRDAFEHIDADPPATLQCAIVADDGVNLVFYDNNTDEFGLAQHDASGGMETIGVRGDVVGVFMAR